MLGVTRGQTLSVTRQKSYSDTETALPRLVRSMHSKKETGRKQTRLVWFPVQEETKRVRMQCRACSLSWTDGRQILAYSSMDGPGIIICHDRTITSG